MSEIRRDRLRDLVQARGFAALGELAQSLGVPFTILDFNVDPATLRQRVSERLAQDGDASDADLSVLERQLATQQPLTPDETRFVE